MKIESLITILKEIDPSLEAHVSIYNVPDNMNEPHVIYTPITNIVVENNIVYIEGNLESE